ncbi:hypothetical protein CBS101457_005694 [Exobasidium rhododendri]|nr:hypothetical protein CBS101457_005694 [Exobasidium rhododendri]
MSTSLAFAALALAAPVDKYALSLTAAPAEEMIETHLERRMDAGELPIATPRRSSRRDASRLASRRLFDGDTSLAGQLSSLQLTVPDGQASNNAPLRNRQARSGADTPSRRLARDAEDPPLSPDTLQRTVSGRHYPETNYNYPGYGEGPTFNHDSNITYDTFQRTLRPLPSQLMDPPLSPSYRGARREVGESSQSHHGVAPVRLGRSIGQEDGTPRRRGGGGTPRLQNAAATPRRNRGAGNTPVNTGGSTRTRLRRRVADQYQDLPDYRNVQYVQGPPYYQVPAEQQAPHHDHGWDGQSEISDRSYFFPSHDESD